MNQQKARNYMMSQHTMSFVPIRRLNILRMAGYVHKQYLINMLICICRNIGHYFFFSVNVVILNIWECSFTMWNYYFLISASLSVIGLETLWIYLLL